ncbi:MAG: FecR family protein [Ignavibacteria bacterium]|nr:FecR family protein [Ignavibacteria bacterium]
MNHTSRLVASVLALGIAVILPPTPVTAGTALFVKIIPDVNHKKGTADWVAATPAGIISVGDMVSTGEEALAVIKFADKSIVKVRENSELVVTGSVDETKIVKEVDVQKGVIGFIIGKQERNDQFRFTSPTSVAAIRGTQGAFTVRGEADTLIVTEGTIRLTNTPSGDSLDVAAGFTGISKPDGSLEVRASTPEEVAAAQESIDSGEADNLFELDLQDGQGNKKKLKIDFKD